MAHSRMSCVIFVVAFFAVSVVDCSSFVTTARLLVNHSSPLGQNVSCDECTDIINVMFEVAKNATVREELINDVNSTCQKLFAHKIHEYQLCVQYGDSIVNQLLPWIDDQLETLAWDARAVCSNFVPVCLNPCCSTPTVPEKLRLSITHRNEMAITWTTLYNTSTHTVQFGTAASGQLANSSNGWARTYTHGGWVGIVHTALMSNLLPNTQYNYRVGDASGGWSAVYSFHTLPLNAGTVERPFNIVQIGDMGYYNKSDATVASITSLVLQGKVDLIIHVGDISYADGDMPHWDVFLSKIENISARVPYMTNPGNHELWYNFTAYKTHFWTPASYFFDNRMFYSFDYGGVHFTQMNTETFEDTANIDNQQLAWLAQDLSNRNRSGFTLATGHRPFYCSTDHGKGKDCDFFASLLRTKAEELLIGHGVDLVITAHMHGYERSWPVAHGLPTARNYILPASPVYVVNGAGGNRESNSNPDANFPWCAGNHTASIGFATITVAGNRLKFDFVIAATGAVEDTFTIIKGL